MIQLMIVGWKGDESGKKNFFLFWTAALPDVYSQL